jgi:lysophospholipid acyltransferase (LPLAT)-like uncharacterized protein
VAVAWRRTLDLCVACPDPRVNPYDPRHAGEYIYLTWHESILAFVFFGLPVLPKAQVLISQHGDGETITQIVKRLRGHVVRGSSTRGGRQALLEMTKLSKKMHTAITPDGPRGPRRRLQSGAIYLASLTRTPIVPVGFGFENAWRARSWDRFAVPIPFSKLTAVAGWPIHVPSDLGHTGLEFWRTQVEASMQRCTEAAEQWASGGARPDSVRLAA